MSAHLFRQVEAQINVVRLAVGQTQPLLVSRAEWTQHNYATAFTRLYALYEGFVKTLISDWVEALPSLVGSYSQLDERIREEYMRGIGRILAGADRGRYQNRVQKNQIIMALYQNLVHDQSERLFAEAFIYHDSNLRGDELNKLFVKIGIKGVCKWLFSHRQVTATAAHLGMSASDALDDLVEQRNNAAHGNTLTTDGPSVLRAYADLTAALCLALSEKVQAERFERYDRASGQYPCVGRIIDYDEGKQAAILRLTPSATLATGDLVLVYHTAKFVCAHATVESLLQDGSPRNEVTGAENTRLELKLSARDLGKKELPGAELFLVSSNR